MKYFRWPPEFINTMTWMNYTLYLASIPTYEAPDAGKEKMEVRDIEDLF